MRFLVVFALIVAVAFAQNTCLRPLSENKFFGTFPATAQRSPVQINPAAGRNVTIIFSRTTAVTEQYAAGSLLTDWRINNLVLQVRYPVQTGNVSSPCSPAQIGTYQVKWSNLCTCMHLDVVQDNCYARRVRYNGLVLNLVVPQCNILASRETLWQTRYVNFNPANELSNLPVQLLIRPGKSKRDVLEYSARGQRRSNWQLDGKGHLIVYDVEARPRFAACINDNANRGIYLVSWYDNCSSFVLSLVSDSCRGRRELYHRISVKTGRITIPPNWVNSASAAVPSLLALFLSTVAFALF